MLLRRAQVHGLAELTTVAEEPRPGPASLVGWGTRLRYLFICGGPRSGFRTAGSVPVHKTSTADVARFGEPRDVTYKYAKMTKRLGPSGLADACRMAMRRRVRAPGGPTRPRVTVHRPRDARSRLACAPARFDPKG